MALKGKTTFELTDVNTGEVEVIEDSNMITNGLQEFLTTYGYFDCNVLDSDYMGTNSLWVNALGGLFLFDTNIDEDANNIFMPAGVRMIGNGSKDTSNSSECTELGSYNATESGLQSDGSVKFVYDFSTQQANGSIACACLTSKLGGYIGMGNASNSRVYSDDFKLNAYRSKSNNECTYGKAVDNRSDSILYPVYNENAIYFTSPYNIRYSNDYATQHWSATKKIQILKIRAGFSSVSIKDKNSLNNVLETYDVAIPQNILDYMGTSKYNAYPYSDNDGNVYIIFKMNSNNSSGYCSLKNGSFFWIMKIDRSMNATSYRFTNNTGKELYFSRETTVFDGEYIWTYSNSSPYTVCGIKYADSTQIIETGASQSSRYKLFVIDKNLIGMCLGKNGNNYFSPSVYDVVNRTMRITNGCLYADNYMYIPFVDKKGVYIMEFIQSDSYPKSTSIYSVMKDPRYLATINNLSEPVVKTASKTMKVTYTITEA